MSRNLYLTFNEGLLLKRREIQEKKEIKEYYLLECLSKWAPGDSTHENSYFEF